MKSIIVYCSKTGNTEKVADAIQHGLGGAADILKLELSTDGLLLQYDPSFTIDLADYDLIFFGGWTMVMKVHPFAAAYIQKCQNIENKTIAGFFTAGAVFSREHVRHDFEHLLAERGARVFDFHFTTTLLGLTLTRGKLQRAEEYARRVLAAFQAQAAAQEP